MKKYLLTNEETASVCDALGYLLEAGVSYADALDILARDEKCPELSKKLSAMAAAADGGSALYQAMEDARCFPAYACRLVQVGEQAGKVSHTLFSLAGYSRRRDAMSKRLRSSLMYPGALLLVLLGVVGVLLIWVMPVFQDVYAGLGSNLGGFAGWLLAFGKGLGKALPWLAGAGAAAAVIAVLPPVKGWIKGLLANTSTAKDIQSARYLQALSLALGCGMAQEEGAILASRLAQGNFAQRCEELCQRLSQGEALAVALEKQGFFTASDRRLLEAAARAGRQDTALETIAEAAVARSEEALERKLGLMEPILVAIGCALIAGILVAVMVPLMGIMNSLG